MHSDHEAILAFVRNNDLFTWAKAAWATLPVSEREAILGDFYARITRPDDPDCEELRSTFTGVSLSYVLSRAEEDDLGNVFIGGSIYLSLYYDIGSGTFSPTHFERQYNRGRGPRH